MRVESAVNIADLGVLARRRLPKVIFDFMDAAPRMKSRCEPTGGDSTAIVSLLVC